MLNPVSALKAEVVKVARCFGLEIARVTATPSTSEWFQSMGIRTIIDVGANIGQSALHLHALLPKAQIFSFEPLPDCYQQLCKTTQHIPLIRSYNLALGDSEGQVKMHRSRFSPSSSLLEMGELHKEAFPFTKGQTVESVRMTTLDAVASQLEMNANIMIKIDVQGYEDKVIKGSDLTLQRTTLVIVETSFYELYGGQPLFSDIHRLLSDRGFAYAGSWGQLASPKNGAPLQQDSIFIKRWWKPAASSEGP